MSGQNLRRLLVLFLVIVTPLGADTLELRNGRKLTGRVIRQDARTIYFKASDGKTASYPKSRVRRIRYGPVPDPAEALRKKQAEQKRKEALRKKREAARKKAAAERKRKTAARKREQERIARVKREQAAKEQAAREQAARAKAAEAARLAAQKKAEAQKAKDEELRKQRAAEQAVADRKAAEARAEKQKQLAAQKRAREEEQRFLKEMESATTKPEKETRPAPATAQKKPEPETKPSSTTTGGQLILQAALANGHYDPDFEKRLATDRFLGGLINAGGFGLNSPWRNKNFYTVPLGLRYERDRWFVGGRLLSARIRPRFNGALLANNVSLGIASNDIFELEQVQSDDFSREQFTILGGYEVHRSDPFSVFVLGGMQSIDYQATFQSRNYTQGRTSALLPGLNANLIGNISELSTSEVQYEAQADGPVLGLSGRYRFGPRWEIDLGVKQYTLSGETRTRSTDYKLTTILSTISVSTFSSSNREQRGEIAYREERGDLSIIGRQFETGISYKMSDRLKLFARITRVVSDVRDSEVKVWLLNSNSAANPYAVEINGETIFIQDLKYSFPGSNHVERLRTLSLGFEQSF